MTQKQVNRQFLRWLIGFILIILISVGSGVLILLTNMDDNYKYIFFFIILIALIFVIGYFKNRLAQITNHAYIIKIHEAPAEPIKTYHGSLESVEKRVLKKDFKLFFSNNHCKLFSRVSRDTIIKTRKRFMLEVVVVVLKGSEFFLDEVNDQIDKLQSEQHKAKVKIDKLFVTQIKEVKEMTEETKTKIKEIAFIRSQNGVISIVNVGLHFDSEQAIMLYSDTYRPSLYYEYHINLIKDII